MDKAMQEIIDKLKAQAQVSQQPTQVKVPEKPVVKAQEQVTDEENVDDAEFYEDNEQKAKSVELDAKAKAEIEMDLLNNNGRFRAELLFQMQELNKALSVIAQILMQNGQRR